MSAPMGPPRRHTQGVRASQRVGPPTRSHAPRNAPSPQRGHHLSPASKRQGPPRQSAAERQLDRVASERGSLYTADGSLRKPRLWHIAVAVSFLAFIAASALSSGLLTLVAFASAIVATVSAWRRSKAAARHLKDVRVTEHFIRSVPRGQENLAALNELQVVAGAGYRAAEYIVHERVFIGAADGPSAMKRVSRLRDAGKRANAEYNRRVPSLATLSSDLDGEDGLAPPVVSKPSSAEDDDISTGDWRTSLTADDTDKDW